MDSIPGSEFLQLDLYQDTSLDDLIQELKGDKAHVVLSDMAPAYIGQSSTDHLRLMELAEMAVKVSCAVLRPSGSLVVKVSRGGTEKRFTDSLRTCFESVKFIKPDASRKDSSEIYVYCQRWKGLVWVPPD
mmetsp:Transcript_13601/g.22759  ORF Transcript_13601/g.22759 Transcript_13601/m.22759 type:complete len:131 (-) Transcript_13601:110-502(-)